MLDFQSYIIVISILLMLVSNCLAGPIQYGSYQLNVDNGQLSTDHSADPLTFDSEESFVGVRHDRNPVINDYQGYYKNPTIYKQTKSEEIISFQPVQPTQRRLYNRRPSSTKVSNAMPNPIRNSNDLWNQIDQSEADGKTGVFLNNKEKRPNAKSSELHLSQSDQSSISDTDDENEDNLLDEFFFTMQSTSTTRPKGYMYKPRPTKKSQPILFDGQDKDDSISFQSLDNAIKKRMCGGSNSSVKDGRCRSTATFS